MSSNTIATEFRALRVRVASDLYKRAGYLAIDRGITVPELIRRLLRAEVENVEANRSPAS